MTTADNELVNKAGNERVLDFLILRKIVASAVCLQLRLVLFQQLKSIVRQSKTLVNTKIFLN